MSDCCSVSKEEKQASDAQVPKAQAPKRHTCPVDKKQYAEVAFKTVLHHIKKPWEQTAVKVEENAVSNKLAEQAYYFCSNPACDVVYFGLDDSVILKKQLRTKVGVKETDDDALLCYCFGVSRLDAIKSEEAKAFVVAQTKNGTCSCATHNPSGKCCLKDFPR